MPTPPPPFRADEVGSLLRPQALKDARAAFAEGRIPAAELKKVEDDEIRAVVAKQEEVGLKAVTDGEFRRAWWHFDFLSHLEGVDLVKGEKAIQFHGVATKSESIVVTGKVDFGDHPMIEHFKFLKSVTKVTPKMTIPSPSVLHFRGGRQAISRDVYPDMESYFADSAEAYRKAVRAFYDAGCRYLQFDDTVWAYLCSEKERQSVRDRGEDPDPLPRIYADMINHAIRDRPDDMIITTHVCRGNFRSSWISEGGYEPVAEVLLDRIGYDGYFLEYDTDRAGGFEPLRFLPKGKKRVVLGLVTSKSGTLESKDDIKRRIEEATKFAPLEQFCLSPQCGFASTEEGNILAEQEQWRKLALIVEIAREVWGEV
ncbi:cobalamin-independent methionine synthase II family protein [Propylenella binzhouense]|uniref:5-methyltetrahydropteroyltriglutamate--homocysteine S-methyltransferase n=1 Tax=Propylenella binzhouense TaxID=2555902 RepID=A0A964T7I9_9HYPH|nr:cobalamin-independent methionine synthase II family protein [Propylenella binzhouense]MYZ48822.1 5-methyltetrahydropteroyltriglutamate--homocysteine S-methyltransferase [Propylenella binzhouense]